MCEQICQRRQAFRARISYPVWYRQLAGPGAELQWQKTVTNDLSAGGVSFGAGIPGETTVLKPGDFLELRLLLPEKPLFIKGKVVREGLDESGGPTFAVSFLSLRSPDADYIARVALGGGLEQTHGKSH